MSKAVTPVVLSDDGNRHEPMREGEVFAVSTLPISTSRQNLIETDATGILLTGEMLVSPLEHNPIINNVDGKLYMRVALMLSPEDKVFRVSDNLLRADVSMSFDPDTSKLSLRGKDNTVISEFTLPVAPGLPTVVEILQDYVPPKPEGFTENPYQKGTYLHMRFRTAEDKSTDIYLDMSKLVDVYTGGRGIIVKNNEVSVAIKDGSVLRFANDCEDPECACPAPLDVDLSLVAERITAPDDAVIALQDGKIVTNLRLDFDSDKQVISLRGKDDASLGEVTLPAAGVKLVFDAAQKIITLQDRDGNSLGDVQLPEVELPEIPGLPVNVEFVDTPPNMAPGKYLHLVFQLAGGTQKDLYIDVTELVDVYSAGEGIKIADRVVSVDHDDTLQAVRGVLGVKVPQLVLDGDKTLRVIGNKIETVLGLRYDAETANLTLVGVDDATVAEVKIPAGVGIPSSADFLLNYQPEGATKPGAYLRLHFDTAQGGKDLFLNVDPLVDVYKAGVGIDISDNVISVKLAEEADNPLVFNELDKLTLDKARLVSKMPDNALSVSDVDNKLFVKDNGLGKDSLGAGLVVGEDGIARVDMRELVTPGTGLDVGMDGKLRVDLEELADLLADKMKVGISADYDNILSVGSDGKPYLPGDLGSL